MEHYFKCASAGLRSRWQEAFSNARSINEVGELPSDYSNVLLWLDMSDLPQGEHQSMLQTYVRPGLHIIVMTIRPNDQEGYELLRAGAFGYCHAVATPSQLQEIATVVQHGGYWVGEGIMKRLIGTANRVAGYVKSLPLENADPKLQDLTEKEFLVAEQVAHGANNREIAEALHMSERTVKAHLSTVFTKLNLRDRVQLALYMNNVPVTGVTR